MTDKNMTDKINTCDNIRLMLRDIEDSLYNKTNHIVTQWYVNQCNHLHTEYFLYYRIGDFCISNTAPQGYKTALKLSIGWTIGQAQTAVLGIVRKLPILPLDEL